MIYRLIEGMTLIMIESMEMLEKRESPLTLLKI